MSLLPNNPGEHIRGRVGFSRGEHAWEEQFDVLSALEAALHSRGIRFEVQEAAVRLQDLGIIAVPRLVGGVHPLERGGVRTATTIEVMGAGLFDRPVFEYQHATGASTQDSLIEGFGGWADGDLVAISEAVSGDLERCTRMELKFKPQDSRLPRLITLGPVTYAAASPVSESEWDEHGPFCHCCLFTQSWEAFRSLVEGHDVAALRLLAMRGADGSLAADCRVNGEDFQVGADALREYASSWPGEGFEMRKQYVLVHTAPDSPH